VRDEYMKKPELTKQESELYLKIVRQGNMDDMFDFAYAIGREKLKAILNDEIKNKKK